MAKNSKTGTALAGVKLAEVSVEIESNRLHTGIADLDAVLGGGFLTGGVVLVAGQPGIGKSRIVGASFVIYCAK